MEKALRYNEGKPKWSLMHYDSMLPMIRVLEFGMGKYARNNWQKGMIRSECLDCIQRHTAAIMDGEVLDEESGLPHAGHLQCNVMFFNYHEKRGTWLPEPEVKEKVIYSVPVGRPAVIADPEEEDEEEPGPARYTGSRNKTN